MDGQSSADTVEATVDQIAAGEQVYAETAVLGAEQRLFKHLLDIKISTTVGWRLATARGYAAPMRAAAIITADWREPADVLAAFADEPWAIGLLSGGGPPSMR